MENIFADPKLNPARKEENTQFIKHFTNGVKDIFGDVSSEKILKKLEPYIISVYQMDYPKKLMKPLLLSLIQGSAQPFLQVPLDPPTDPNQLSIIQENDNETSIFT
jgi:hypothetical protein